MTSQQGYSLMYAVVHGNVVGAVIAPKGTEHLPRDERAFVWRALIKPLIDEVAQGEEFPAADVKKVALDLFEFCRDEGLAIPMDVTESSGG